MALPPVVVAVGFLIAVAAALALMAYVAWKGSKPSDFFVEAVKETYSMQLNEGEIDAYYELKEKLQQQYAPELLVNGSTAGAGDGEAPTPWTHRATPEERAALQKALLQRLVGNVDKLDQVQRDKPGNWKLWRGKLVSERYWDSLCDAERLIGEEIDACVAEADEVEPGWRSQIFQHAVQCWRMQKQKEVEKKMQKKAVEQKKKEIVKEEKKKENEEKKAVEDKLRQERLAEKAMEKLLKEEAKEQSSKAKAKAKAKAPNSGSKKK